MSDIKDLINDRCPNGVDFLNLKVLAEITTGKSDRRNADENGKYPFYVRSKDILRINKYEYDETAIVIPGEGGVGEIFHFVRGKYALHQRAYRIHVISKKLNTKFLYYYMLSEFKSFINTKAVIATVTSIRKPMIEEFEIPIPPLEVQNEIVYILDKFTELTAELTARKKQYNFYLNSFFQNQIDNYVSLDSIGKLTRGKRFVHADATEEGIPCIHYGELYTYYGIHANKAKSHIRDNLRTKMRYAHKGDVVIVVAGENNIDIGIGVAWEGNEDIAVHDACYIFSHNQNSKYISYFLRSDLYHKQIKKYVSEGKICAISAMNLGKVLIPLPSLDTQQAIVEKLDSFNKLCMDITIGLPAEIEWRKKQYEYYRDKLLSFEVKCHD